MQNKIDAVLTAENRDAVLAKLAEVKSLLNLLTDLTVEDRKTLFKMGDWGRPVVENTLLLAEQDDSFLPRSFDVAEMRQDKELYDRLMPIYVEVSKLNEALEDTLMLVGSDLMMNALDIYRSANDNGVGEHLDNLIPLVARRFKRSARKDNKSNESGGNGNDDPPQE